MVDREVLGQANVDRDFLRAGALGGRDDVEDLRADEAAEEFEGVLLERLLFRRWLMAVADERFERGATVLDRAGKHVEQGVVVDGEARDQRLGRRDLEFGEGGLVPMDIAFFGGLALLEALLFVGGRLGGEAEVFDDVFGRLGDDVAGGVEAAPARAADDLAEVADGEDLGAAPVVFAEGREHHRADRDVDPHAEGIGAANDFEQAAGGELFDQQAVFRQQAGVVNADAVAQDLGKLAAVGAAEIGVVEGAGDRGLFLLGAEVGRKQVAGGVGAGVLGEVNEVNRRAARLVELGDFFLKLGGGVFELQRNRALVGLDERGRRAREVGELFGEKRGVA